MRLERGYQIAEAGIKGLCGVDEHRQGLPRVASGRSSRAIWPDLMQILHMTEVTSSLLFY